MSIIQELVYNTCNFYQHINKIPRHIYMPGNDSVMKLLNDEYDLLTRAKFYLVDS